MTFAKLKCFLLWHLKRGAWKLFWKLLHMCNLRWRRWCLRLMNRNLVGFFVFLKKTLKWCEISKIVKIFKICSISKFVLKKITFFQILLPFFASKSDRLFSNPKQKWTTTSKTISHKLPRQSLGRVFFVISPAFKQISWICDREIISLWFLLFETLKTRSKADEKHERWCVRLCRMS